VRGYYGGGDDIAKVGRTLIGMDEEHCKHLSLVLHIVQLSCDFFTVNFYKKHVMMWLSLQGRCRKISV